MSRTGWVVATGAELEPRHPEKVLMLRRDFAEQHEAEHLALIAALVEAGHFCDAPKTGSESSRRWLSPRSSMRRSKRCE
jgi:ABC-type nitrate/sulfonate/bicarbonate transport system substrate-binding protein